MRTSAWFGMFLSLMVFLVAGCGGGEKGEDVAKEMNAELKAQIDEIAKSPEKATEIQEKHKKKIEEIQAKAAKLSEAEKKIYAAKLDVLDIKGKGK